MSNLTSCEWETVPSLRQVVPAFLPICLDMIQLNYKSCTDIVPWYKKMSWLDFLILASMTGFLTALKPIAMVRTLRCLTSWCNNAGEDLKRASEMIYELATRVFIVVWVLHNVLIAPDCSYLVAPTQVLRLVWLAGATGADMSLERRLLLLFTISRYASALIDVLFIAEKRRDSISLVIHHVVAILMMTTAYTTFPELGLSVFLLHEACDPSLELAKILHYLQRSKSGETSRALSIASDVCFSLFTIKWFILRIYLYPVRGIFPATAVDKSSCQYGSYAAAALLGSFLFVLNIVWSCMIIRALANRLVYNRLTDETMERPQDYDQKYKAQKDK